MPQLLPDNLVDPALGEPVQSDPIEYGTSWQFHLGDNCPCPTVEYGPHIAVRGNRAVRIEGINTLIQWIRMTLITDRYRWPIFDNQYGSEFNEIIENTDDAEEAKTEITRTIREALLIDDRIQAITDITILQDDENRNAVFVDVSLVTFAGDLSLLQLNLTLSEGA